MKEGYSGEDNRHIRWHIISYHLTDDFDQVLSGRFTEGTRLLHDEVVHIQNHTCGILVEEVVTPMMDRRVWSTYAPT